MFAENVVAGWPKCRASTPSCSAIRTASSPALLRPPPQGGPGARHHQRRAGGDARRFWGSHLGVIDLVLDDSSGRWKVADGRAHLRPVWDRATRKPLVEPDPPSPR
jgi:hypothetical protein